MTTPTRVLITGGAGFIGSHVADHCLRLGMDVLVVDDLSGGAALNVPHGAKLLRADVTDPQAVDALWHQGGPFRFVYHLAAYAAEGLSPFIRRFNYQNNVIGSMNVINGAVRHGVERLVFTSSIAVYGSRRPPVREGDVPQPEDPYGIAKYAVELDLSAAERLFGLPYTIFRPHNVYGERQNIRDPYRNVVGIFMRQLLDGHPMTIFGDGAQTRAFTYIDDVARIIAAAPLTDGTTNATFNVGSDEVHTVREVADLVAAALGRPAEVMHVGARRESVHTYADHSLMRETFRTPAPVRLEDGIRRMARWAMTADGGAPPSLPPVEVDVKLPRVWATPAAGRRGPLSAP